MRLLKKMMACMLLMMLLSPHALAAFSPALDQLEQMWDEKTPMTLTVSAEASALAGAGEKALAALQRLLAETDVHLTANCDGDSRIKITYRDENVIHAVISEKMDGTRIDFPDMNESFYTPAGEQNVLAHLTGSDMLNLPRLKAARELLWQRWDALYALLTEYGAEPGMVHEAAAIRSVGTAGQYERYTLEADELNAVWPHILQWLQPVLEEAYPDAVPEELAAALSSLVFAGKGTIRRVMDKENTDWGLQFDGNVYLDEGDVRKATVIVGWRQDKGFMLSVAAPAVKGSNTLKMSLGGAYTLQKNGVSLALSASCTRTAEDENRRVSMEGTIKCISEEGQDAITGKLSVTARGADGKTTYTIKPDLYCIGKEVQGSVKIASSGDRGESDWTLGIALCPDLDFSMPNDAAATNFSQLNEEDQKAALRRMETALSRSMMRLIMQIPQEDRALLTHLMRTDAWMTAPSVPVLEDDAALWIVEEENEP